MSRSFIGWPRFSSLSPNPTHRRLSDWEDSGLISHLVTQNVDGLHSKAGIRSVTELHGSNWRVKCVECGTWSGNRNEFQEELRMANPEFSEAVKAAMGEGKQVVRPDGDVALPKVILRPLKASKVP